VSMFGFGGLLMVAAVSGTSQLGVVSR
jgi:hypothetical protein